MKVAFGEIIITPPDFLGGYLGKPLAGYTPAPRAKGKYDDIKAHAVLIEDIVLGNVKKRLLLISLDYLKIPLLWSDYVKEKIEERYRIHRKQILLHAIHTHKSMDMTGEFVFAGGLINTIRGIVFGAYHGDDKYKIWVAKQLVNLTGKLIEQLKPAEIAWTKKRIEDDLIFNRRHPERRSKSDLSIISFRDLNTKEIIGVIVSYGAHPTTLANFVDKMSADYPARVIEKIEQLSQGKIKATFFTAPAGDINPITTISKDYDQLAKLPQQELLNQRGDILHTKKIGYNLGKYAYELTQTLMDDDYYDKIDFKCYSNTFWVPMRDFTRYKAPFKFQQSLIHWIKRYILFPIALFLGDIHEPNFPGFAVKHRDILSPKAKINIYSEVVLIRIKVFSSKNPQKPSKEINITGIPGELFEDIAKEISERNPAGSENTFIFQNANDWISYLFPIKEYISSGGYEPFASFSPLCGDFVKFAYFRMLEDIKYDIIGGYY
ncbi:MAG: hypothetical protein ACTSRZ_14055 [Promethearchaeota archaeon]